MSVARFTAPVHAASILFFPLGHASLRNTGERACVRRLAGSLADGWMIRVEVEAGERQRSTPNSGEENGKFSWNPRTSVELEIASQMPEDDSRPLDLPQDACFPMVRHIQFKSQ